jgi:hypothetical protein
MNSTAAPVVILVRKFPAPREPKTVWLRTLPMLEQHDQDQDQAEEDVQDREEERHGVDSSLG